MSLCPESEYRAGLSDDEFWAHVFGQDGPDIDYDPADDPYAPEDELGEEYVVTPCLVCGVTLAACSYDVDGRPMVHVIPLDNE